MNAARDLAIVGFACSWLAPAAAHAAGTRAYVSVSGNDANTCSSPATPCRTLTGAIAQTTPGGEVVVLDSGTYGGATISQAVTVNAPRGVVAVVATSIVVNAGPSDVVALRGLTFISPTTNPVYTALASNGGVWLNVERCVFHGWNIGINFGSGKLNVTDTTVRDGHVGISLHDAGFTTIDRTRIVGNEFGLGVNSPHNLIITNSLVAGNSNTGLIGTAQNGTSWEITVEGCVITGNGTGVNASSTGWMVPGTIRLSNSTVVNNGIGVQQIGVGVLLSRGNNTIEGNTTDTSGTIGSFGKK
jgi:hypothetical protein